MALNPETDYVAEIAKILMHPIRVRCLLALTGGDTVNPRAVSESVQQPLNDVAYHFRKLAYHGAAEIARTEPVRGATRHYYVITPFGEEVGTWARKMERHARKREQERAHAEAA
jgi:hypothetical protein